MAREPSFEWDDAKDRANRLKHGVSFAEAQAAFLDPRRVVAEDLEHGALRAALLLLRSRRRRHYDGAFHLARRPHPHLRRRLLAERKANL